MKPKHFEKKLILNKKTISNLNLRDMLEIRAGDVAPTGGKETCAYTCETYVVSCPSQCHTNCKTCPA